MARDRYQILLGFGNRGQLLPVSDGCEAGDRLVLKNLFRLSCNPACLALTMI